MSALAELTIFPLDKGESVSKYAAKAIKIIQQSGMNYTMGSMSTCFEGEWDDVMNLAKNCMDTLKEECDRIYMVLKVDYRSRQDSRIDGKIDSVKKYL